MEENEILVYLFTGFLESGKTSLIQGTLEEPDFMNGEKGLLICCEEGEVEYDEEFLKKINVELVVVEDAEEFTPEFLQKCNDTYHPNRVFIEYNGMWTVEDVIEMEMPENWITVQVLTTIDASTFQTYMNNMGGMMVQQFAESDAVIFNRCDTDTPTAAFRRLVKANNRRAQIIYERKDGTIDNGMEEEMPFDLNADIVDISEEDYGIWYMDAVDNYKKYNGKKVKFLALVYNPDKLKNGIMVPGRFAMTCCADDITFIGFKCKYPKEKEIPHKSWITITAEVRVEFAMEYKGKGPVLYPISIEPAEKPQDELVYFS